MSIVVTCDCTMEYRLPDRYAGKRCRCRECGGRIEVPRAKRSSRTSGEEETRKRSKKKAKARAKAQASAAKAKEQREADKAAGRRRRATNSTTRRLSRAQQDREIISERNALHSSQGGRGQRRAVSESMHQLAPMRSGDRLERHVGLTPPPGKQTRRPKTGPEREARRSVARRTERADPRSNVKAALKAPKTRGRANGARETAKVPSKGNAKAKRPARKTRARRAGDDAATTTRARESKSPTTHALYAVIAIVGVLCLGIGLVVGGAFNGKSGDAVALGGTAKKLDDLQTMKKARNWAGAKAAADALEAELGLAGDQESLGKLYALRAGIDKMVQIVALEDDETRLTALVDFSSDDDPTVRAGCVWELRGICEQDDARHALVNLTSDPDKTVATAARQAMVQAGGPEAIPFLLEAIEATAATGGKQGDVALARAVEIDDPAVVPVLLKILELRPNAPASALRQVLNRLAELGTAECVPAVEPFTESADEELAEVAKAVVKELSSRAAN